MRGLIKRLAPDARLALQLGLQRLGGWRALVLQQALTKWREARAARRERALRRAMRKMKVPVRSKVEERRAIQQCQRTPETRCHMPAGRYYEGKR